MTKDQKIARAKMSLLELAKHLNNVSAACRVTGVSRQHFYDIRRAYEEGGLEALTEQSRRKPDAKNRVPESVEKANHCRIEFPSGHDDSPRKSP